MNHSAARAALMMRVGRSAVAMGQQEFADLLGLAKSTIARNETLEMEMRLSTVELMEESLADMGVTFSKELKDGGFTVRVSEKAVTDLLARLEDPKTRRSDRNVSKGGVV
jgi:predicted transcriptional regulator